MRKYICWVLSDTRLFIISDCHSSTSSRLELLDLKKKATHLPPHLLHEIHDRPQQYVNAIDCQQKCQPRIQFDLHDATLEKKTRRNIKSMNQHSNYILQKGVAVPHDPTILEKTLSRYPGCFCKIRWSCSTLLRSFTSVDIHIMCFDMFSFVFGCSHTDVE